MDEIQKIIRANIVSQKNWETIENYMEENLVINENLIFVTFCEMFFYKKRKSIKNEWVGIIHDPEDTQKYHHKKIY